MWATASPPALGPRRTRPTICFINTRLVVGRASTAVLASGRSTPSRSIPTLTRTIGSSASRNSRSTLVRGRSDWLCTTRQRTPACVNTSPRCSAWAMVPAKTSVLPHCSRLAVHVATTSSLRPSRSRRLKIAGGKSEFAISARSAASRRTYSPVATVCTTGCARILSAINRVTSTSASATGTARAEAGSCPAHWATGWR